MVHGLPLTVSPAASDLLAAFHLGFSEAMDFWREVSKPGPPEQIIPGFGPDGDEVEEDYAPPSGLTPMALAAWYEAKRMRPEFPEADNPEDHPAYKAMEEDMGLRGLGDEGAKGK